MNQQKTAPQPRLGAGNVHGGEYTFKQQTGASIALLRDPQVSARRQAARDAIGADGYTPARLANAETGGTAADWWLSHIERAEVKKKGGYPKLPEMNSSGRRHVLQTYSGSSVQIKMPSAATIKKFSYDNGGTFDVPVSGVFPGGTVSGWVRLTQNGLNEWSVQGINFPDDNHQLVAEAVSAVLEARRPRVALAEAGNLITRRLTRFHAMGNKIEPPAAASTFIRGVGYDRDREVMMVKIADRSYGYKVTPAQMAAFNNATSVGAAYNKIVKGHQRVDVKECTSCHRFSVAAAVHRCPSKHFAPPSPRRLAEVSAR